MAMQPILPTKATITIATMLNFDSDFDGYIDGEVLCKQAFTSMKKLTRGQYIGLFLIKPLVMRGLRYFTHIAFVLVDNNAFFRCTHSVHHHF